ncbi:MAG: hypothetical protein FWC10_10655 [Lentimicrobiaceae bacterium]|nr:hypothetical protein [Lentimicrobiaceae bacterium]
MKKHFFLVALIFTTLLINYQTVAQEIEINNISKKGTPKTDAIGFDLGIGALLFKETVNVSSYNMNYSYTEKIGYPVFAAGFRYTHFFNPYIAMDAIKINLNCPFRAKRNAEYINMQFMLGIRGNTPVFFKTMSGYAAVRMGYGLHFMDHAADLLLGEQLIHGIAFETEIGLNINNSILIGFSYNLMSSFADIYGSYYPYGSSTYMYSANQNFNTYALRIGFNF